jgi:hypothetical protein
MERTRGSEPSQYPEEEKSIEIPKVVASEIGTAQTRRFARRAWGCRTTITPPAAGFLKEDRDVEGVVKMG